MSTDKKTQEWDTLVGVVDTITQMPAAAPPDDINDAVRVLDHVKDLMHIKRDTFLGELVKHLPTILKPVIRRCPHVAVQQAAVRLAAAAALSEEGSPKLRNSIGLFLADLYEEKSTPAAPPYYTRLTAFQCLSAFGYDEPSAEWWSTPPAQRDRQACFEVLGTLVRASISPEDNIGDIAEAELLRRIKGSELAAERIMIFIAHEITESGLLNHPIYKKVAEAVATAWPQSWARIKTPLVVALEQDADVTTAYGLKSEIAALDKQVNEALWPQRRPVVSDWLRNHPVPR